MRATLRAVADHGTDFPAQKFQVGVSLGINARGHTAQDGNADGTDATREVNAGPFSPSATHEAALSRKQRTEEAVDHLTKAVQIRPSYPDAYYNLGNVLYALGRWPEAILSYRRALTLTPADWQMHNNLGVAILKSGDQSSVEIEFERTLLLNPECSSAQRNLATLRQISQKIPTLAGSLP